MPGTGLQHRNARLQFKNKYINELEIELIQTCTRDDKLLKSNRVVSKT